MRRTDGRRATATRAAMLLVGLSLSAALACTQEAPPPRVLTAVVRLAAAKDRADSVNLVLTRLRPLSIPADTMFDTLRGVGDEQRLMMGSWPRATYGPRAKIQPHRAASYLTEADRDTGAVIARIINLDTIPYPKFNLQARDTVYWWVGRRHGELVSVFISSMPRARPWVSNLEIDYHANTLYYQPLARWLWNDHDEEAWGTCDGGRCCRSTGEALR